MSLSLAVAGATGLVGARILELIAADMPDASVGAFASASSAGRTVRCGAREVTVQDLAACDFGQYDAALFAIGDELSAQYVPRALAAGCAVVDKSNAFRLAPDVPLVVSGVNDGAITAQTPLVANPNCSTIILTHALAPLAQRFGLRRVWAATYQSVSGAGTPGVDKLAAQMSAAPAPAELAAGAELDPAGFAYNVIPSIGSLDAHGRCGEEAKLVDETRKILDRPDLPITAHAVRVPVVVGHSIAATLELGEPADEADILAAWAHSPDLRWLGAGLPGPLSSQRHTQVEVGRLRRELGDGSAWSFFLSGDNVMLGAALNGWRILQRMTRAGAVRSAGTVAAQ